MRQETNNTNNVCCYCKKQLSVRHASHSEYPLYLHKEHDDIEYLFQILQCRSCWVEFIYIWKDSTIVLTLDIGDVPERHD